MQELRGTSNDSPLYGGLTLEAVAAALLGKATEADEVAGQ
jgi:hypothetical protein